MATQIAPSTTSWSRFLSLPGWVKSVMVGWVAAMLLAVGIAVASDSTPKPVLPPAAGASASPSPTADPAKEAAAAASFAGSAVGDGLAEAPAAGGRTGFGVLSDATAIPTASNIAATHPTITDLTQPGRD